MLLRPACAHVELLDVIKADSPLLDFLAICIASRVRPDRFPRRGRIELMRKLVHEDHLVLHVDVGTVSVQWSHFNKISS